MLLTKSNKDEHSANRTITLYLPRNNHNTTVSVAATSGMYIHLSSEDHAGGCLGMEEELVRVKRCDGNSERAPVGLSSHQL